MGGTAGGEREFEPAALECHEADVALQHDLELDVALGRRARDDVLEFPEQGARLGCGRGSGRGGEGARAAGIAGRGIRTASLQARRRGRA